MDKLLPPSSLAATGAFLLVPTTKPHAYQMASRLVAILQPPLAAPFAREITALLDDAVDYTLGRLEMPKPEVLEVGQDLKELRSVIQAACTEVQLHSSALSLRGKASSDPVWYELAQVADHNRATRPMRLYIGCALLLGLYRNSSIPKVAAMHLREMSQVQMTDATLDALLAGLVPAEQLASAWTTRLAKMWREIIRLFSGGDAPPPTIKQRITGQLLGAALNPPPAHVAGAQTHRQLSSRQFIAACQHIRERIAEEELDAVLGVLVVRTGISVDVLVQLPLQTGLSTVSGAHLDPAQGIVLVDLQPLVFEPARSLPGCHSGGYLLTIHLPCNIAKQLRARSTKFPFASTLMDLYPGSRDVLTHQRLIHGEDEIAPSWARLRQSTGTELLRRGFNALHAALLTLDFSLVCRSKLHYAVVPAKEWLWAEQRLHTALGWDEPVDPVAGESGVGSRVVPTDATMQRHDEALAATVEATRPGQHASTQALVSFHNQFTYLTGWRISVLLALRASSRLSIPANLGSGDKWAAVHDKHTPNDTGLQPVPICDFVLETVQLYRRHCAAMSERLTRQGHGNLQPARWCKAVSEGLNLRLLCTLEPDDTVRPLASHSFCTPMDDGYQLPEDPGRKVLENALRAEGLPSSLVDRMLRHTHAGQLHLGSFNALPQVVAHERLATAIERTARRLFKTPTAGLRKD